MKKIHKHYGVKQTPQSQPIPGRSDMVENAAGGYAFELDKWGRLDRFLVLGTEGGTYYVTERELTVDAAENVVACIKEDGGRAVERIVEVSEGGKAAKNDYALFALALATTFGEEATRKAAYAALPRVARTGTHLFVFLNYVESMRGWSRGLRGAVGRWYTEREPKDLAYQVTKYRQRYGFSHRDALRLAHPEPPTQEHGAIFGFVTQEQLDDAPSGEATDYLLHVTELAGLEKAPEEAARLIAEYRLPREVVPTPLLNEKVVWEALLGEDGSKMPLTALIRNLGNLTKVGVLVPMNDLSGAVAERLRDPEAIRRARIHPMAVMTALITYRSGGGYRGSGSWTPVQEIVEGLESAFYAAFENVEPTGKRIVYGVDVSGSMTWGQIAGVPGLTPAMAAGAMALVSAAIEERCAIWGFDHELVVLPITARSTLPEAMAATSRNGGATDASLPMRHAIREGVEADAFVILTDSETWYGNQHPVQALAEYRRATGIPSRLVVVGMTATGSTIGDPQDAGVLDVVGLSTDTPRLVADFIRG